MITSKANSRASFLRSLHSAKGRRETGCFLVEGIRLVEEALRFGEVRLVLADADRLATSPRGRQLLDDLARKPWEAASEEVIASVSSTESPQGIIAAVAIPKVEPRAGQAALIVVLDGVSDPGNMGTVLREAAAFGVEWVVPSRGCVDVYSPKVVRAGAGAHFHVGIAPGFELSEIRCLFDPCTYYAASSHEGHPYYDVDWRGSKALIVGSEAHGLGRDAKDLCDGQVSIPMDERVESLNAAVACGIILAEAFRQRRGRVQSTVLGVD